MAPAFSREQTDMRTVMNSLKPILSLAVAGALSLVAVSATASGQRTVIEKNHVMRVSLSAPAGSVIVANPDIADVNIVDSRTIYILGKGFGSSAVTVTGRDGKPLFDGEIVVTAVQKGGITVYKGLKPSLMVCSNICVDEQTDGGSTAPGQAPPSLVPSTAMAMPAK
jgi:Flp pilus assembly secretin CpaC